MMMTIPKWDRAEINEMKGKERGGGKKIKMNIV
jgi:hypothetical protein